MVFGFFSRKQPPPGESVRSELADPRKSPLQLRTPSPSITASSAMALPDPPDPSLSPSPETDTDTDPLLLHARISAVPPQTLHAYMLRHVPPAVPLSAGTLEVLNSFFAALAPPPRLHCVRCHKSYFDVENTDRSCLVPHDDDSAEVERVSAARASIKAMGYETLWGCCGRTVEGDGDMGPPDGWCYEGKHTTDMKRARFRADATMSDDKLLSCENLHCHDPTYRTTRKRRRGLTKKTFDAEAEYDSESTSTEEISPRQKRVKTTAATEAMNADSNPHPPKSPAQKPRLRAAPRSKSGSAHITASDPLSASLKSTETLWSNDKSISPKHKSSKHASTSSPKRMVAEVAITPSMRTHMIDSGTEKGKIKFLAKSKSVASMTAAIEQKETPTKFGTERGIRKSFNTHKERFPRKESEDVRKKSSNQTLKARNIITEKPSSMSLKDTTSVSPSREKINVASVGRSKPLVEIVDTSVDGEGFGL